MVLKNKYPICEFDTGKNPIIQATNFLVKSLPEKCVVTFFRKELEQFDINSLVTALMGASPKTNRFCERLFPDIDFETTRKNIGRIRIETVEDMQNQIISMLNLQAVEKR